MSRGRKDTLLRSMYLLWFDSYLLGGVSGQGLPSHDTAFVLAALSPSTPSLAALHVYYYGPNNMYVVLPSNTKHHAVQYLWTSRHLAGFLGNKVVSLHE